MSIFLIRFTMKSKIKFYYNLFVDELKEYDKYIVFSSNKNSYILKKINGNNLDFISNSDNFYENFIIPILNVNQEYITVIDNEKYVLLKVGNKNRNLYLDFSPIELVKENANFTHELWIKKIDYCRLQLINFFTNASNVVYVDAFNYFSGMAENAIAIMKKIELSYNSNKKYLSHYRMYYPNNSINYYDPTEYTIDYLSRDYAEYTKSKFFKTGAITNEELKHIINKVNVNDFELLIFYCRLLFPTYFFDLFEEKIFNSISDEEITKVINLIPEYKSLLKNIYTLCINVSNGFPNITWINLI